MYNKNLLFILLLIAGACTKQPNTNVLRPLSETNTDEEAFEISLDSIKNLKTGNLDECLNISIPNEPNEVCLDTVFSSYKFIPLQTTEKSIIGRIEKILVCDDCFCILDRDNSNVFLFEKDGRFRCRLGEKGHGPGEHLDAWNVAYDKDNKEIVLLDLTGRKLMHYNLKGKLQRVESLFYLYTALEYQKDKMIIYTGTAYNAFSDILDLNQLIIADRNQNPKACGYKTSEFMRREFFYASILKKCGDEIIYDDMLSDTLWCISNFEKYPLAVVNFEKSPRFSNEEKMRMTGKLFEERNNQVGSVNNWQISSNYIYLIVRT
ncbi:MAG: 6-bladed beta-propeller, partial [Bacteroidales bacterium]|nr:6-bladed beta-propeller [Bacteroidales bacterium]